MKRIRNIALILFAILTVGCNSSSNNVFDSDKLRGKYKVELAPLIAEVLKTEKDEKEDWSSSLAKGMAAAMFSSINMEVSFYENNKAIYSVNGGLVDFAQSMSDKPTNNLIEFLYRVEHDSILFIGDPKTGEFEKKGTIKKISDNYDFIQFVSDESEKEPLQVTLRKIQD